LQRLGVIGMSVTLIYALYPKKKLKTGTPRMSEVPFTEVSCKLKQCQNHFRSNARFRMTVVWMRIASWCDCCSIFWFCVSISVSGEVADGFVKNRILWPVSVMVVSMSRWTCHSNWATANCKHTPKTRQQREFAAGESEEMKVEEANGSQRQKQSTLPSVSSSDSPARQPDPHFFSSVPGPENMAFVLLWCSYSLKPTWQWIMNPFLGSQGRNMILPGWSNNTSSPQDQHD
jgi:hypothetical protein